MSQPKWKFIANLGDANPLDHDGFFVYVDENGFYSPEAEVVQRQDESDDPHYMVYRFPLYRCTFKDGILSDNQFHHDYPAWFAKPEENKMERPQDTNYLSRICETMDIDYEKLVKLFCSGNPLENAEAYRYVGEYHGYDNLDTYPLKMRRRELCKRYQINNGKNYGKRG